jgi:hypothetical protein
VATRYDKLAVRYEATIHIALINEWLLPKLTSTPWVLRPRQWPRASHGLPETYVREQ